MTVGLGLLLLGLALLDSTSFGTLLIPIWLLLSAGRLRIGRILVYLGAVAGFYFAVGVLLVATAGALRDGVTAALADIPEPPLRIGQLAVGVVLFGWSYRLEARANQAGGRPGRIQRWRERAMSGQGGYLGLIGLALLAAGLEVATMLPYLGAIGALVVADLAWPTTVAVLAGYCVVMCLPAVMLAGGAAARSPLDRPAPAAAQRLADPSQRQDARMGGRRPRHFPGAQRDRESDHQLWMSIAG